MILHCLRCLIDTLRLKTISLGEFSSPKQGTFYHYNDFWRLDPSSREWTRVESKGKGPPARSGHRMTYFKVRSGSRKKIHFSL